MIVFGTAEWQFYYNLFCEPVFFISTPAKTRWAPNRYPKRRGFANPFFFKCQPKRNLKVDFNFHRQSKCCNPNSFELFHFSRTFHPLRCWTWTGPPEPPTPVEEAELSLQAKQVGVFFVGWDFVSPKLDITFHWSSSQYYTLNLMFSRVWFEKLGLRSVFSTVAFFFPYRQSVEGNGSCCSTEHSRKQPTLWCLMLGCKFIPQHMSHEQHQNPTLKRTDLKRIGDSQMVASLETWPQL